MPIFEYVCRSCGEGIETLRPVAARDEIVHCTCGGDMSRKLSAPGRVWAPTRAGQ